MYASASFSSGRLCLFEKIKVDRKEDRDSKTYQCGGIDEIIAEVPAGYFICVIGNK